MGLIMKNGRVYGGSGDAASNIAYDSTSSGLPVSTVQSAIDYLNENGIGKADTEGIIVNVEIGNWIEQSDGTFTNTITVSEVTAKDIYDVSLYGDFSEEQAEAFDFLVSSIDTLNGKVVLTASEKIDVAFSIILRGKVNLENKNVYVSDLSATSIEYDNSKSGLDATNMQNAMDEIATMVNGLVVNVTADGWNLQNDGTYKKTILIEQITGKETLDVCLYPGDVHSEEQIVAFSELISSIDTGEGMITLIAVEEITVSFRIFLYGKVNFDKNNLVALTDNIIEIIPISEEEFNKKSEAEKAAGNYLVDDGEDDEFLSARNIEFDGSEIGIDADNVHDAISELNSNLPFKLGIDENGNYGYIKDGADTVIPFKTGVITETELDGLRSEIIAPLKNASSDINDDSSFSDIVSILWDLYPNEILMKLYSAGANTGNFAQFGSNGVSSVSIGSSSIGLSSRYDEDAIGHVGIITASKYNLDKLTKLTITYSASSTISKSTAPYVAYVKIGLFKNKSFSDTEAIIFTLANNFASAGGTIINDISDISGEYYIGVMIHAPYYYKDTTSCSITEITLSNY